MPLKDAHNNRTAAARLLGVYFPFATLSDGASGHERMTASASSAENDGWLPEARHIVSPNFDERPVANDICLVVIHAISLPPGLFGGQGIIDLFTNQLNPEDHPYYREIAHLRVSAHFLIRRSGELIQFVSLLKRAWACRSF
jgi:N-acetyl-anhydromuramyl-L-alanine amidase AmpD